MQDNLDEKRNKLLKVFKGLEEGFSDVLYFITLIMLIFSFIGVLYFFVISNLFGLVTIGFGILKLFILFSLVFFFISLITSLIEYRIKQIKGFKERREKLKQELIKEIKRDLNGRTTKR